jgi:hypothetical protein
MKKFAEWTGSKKLHMTFMNIRLRYTEKVCCGNCKLRRIHGGRGKDKLTGAWGKLRNG